MQLQISFSPGIRGRRCAARIARGTRALLLLLGAGLTAPLSGQAQYLPDMGPALGSDRVTQAQIQDMSLEEIRRAGLKIFATPFNREDGYGDGPMDPGNPDQVSAGNRPALLGGWTGAPRQGNARRHIRRRGISNETFLRVNGLDTQTCLECHGMVSADRVPATMGVGGSGGLSATALFQARFYDVADKRGKGFAAFDGRAINPPAIFGAGGVQLLAKEMTAELQRLRQQALDDPGTLVRLITKGVDFGRIRADSSGSLDTSGVEGLDQDLVVRPFGRKGEFASTRAFGVSATQFHMGMQPVEVVGRGIDEDGDGVYDELLVGEISAMEIFMSTIKRPRELARDSQADRGESLFGDELGCADCHLPLLETRSPYLRFGFPEVETDPASNLYYEVDLRDPQPGFEQAAGTGGVAVRLYSDLKRHDLGDGLAESFFEDDRGRLDPKRNREFITAKLWGVADSAPYLHDGRALSLSEAILAHGGEAQAASDAFRALPDADRRALIAFLRTLRAPEEPNGDILGP